MNNHKMRQRLLFGLHQLSSKTPGGIGRYSQQLFTAMKSQVPEEFEFIPVAQQAEAKNQLLTDDSTKFSKIPLVIEKQSWALGGSLGWKLNQPTFEKAIHESIYSPSLLCPLLSNSSESNKHITTVTIHDLIPLKFPELFTRRGVKWHRTMIARAKQWANFVACPSEVVKSELLHLGFREESLLIVPGAPSLKIPTKKATENTANLLNKLDGKPYLLFMGNWEPRKGIAEIIEALSRNSLDGIHLVLTGGPGWGNISPYDIARELCMSRHRIHVTGWVDDNDLSFLITKAKAVVVLSKAEGFGLPIVEAMNLGTPVIHSSDPALIETAGGAGICIDLTSGKIDIDQLEASIDDLIRSAESSISLINKGFTQSKKFSWEISAKSAWSPYR